MNLLEKKADKNSKLLATMLDILKQIVQPENFEVAVRFLDFSKEMDLNLLDDVVFQDMETDQSSTPYSASQRLFYEMEDNNTYIDRYILFLDALGANTIGRLLYYRTDIKLIEKILPRAFSLRYDETDTKAKIAALIAEGLGFLDFNNVVLNKFAKDNPEILLRATLFCKGEYVNAKLKLIAIALCHTDPKNTLIDKDYIEYMLDVIQNENNTQKDKTHVVVFIMLLCFMSYHHDMRFKEICINTGTSEDVLKDFAYYVLSNIEENYIRDSADDLMEILFKDREHLVSKCMLHILHTRAVRGFSGNNEEQLLYAKTFISPLFTEVAKRYPEEYIKAMNYKGDDVNLGNFISILYDILNEVTGYYRKSKKDIMTERLIYEEENNCKPSFAESVVQYLKGEISLADLSDFFDEMHNNSYSIVRTSAYLIKQCLKENDDFQRRYLALKCIFGYNAVRDLLLYGCCTIENIIHAAVAENVPINYRFTAYEYIYDEYYSIEHKTNIWTAVLNMMVKMKNDKNDEYGDYCYIGRLFYRILYINYLDQTNDNDCNKALIFQLCTDSAAAVRRLAGLAIAKHKSYEPEVLELLKSKKAAVREVGIDVLAKWGAKKHYVEILTELAENEKSNKLIDKIHNILGSTLETDNTDGTDNSSPTYLVEQLTKGGRSRKLSWLYNIDDFNDKVHLLNGAEAGTKYMQALLLCYADTDKLGRSDSANLLAERLNQEELNRFAGNVFSAWLDYGAEAKKRWVLYFCAIHGGSAMIDALLHYIKEWAENSRGAIAAEAVNALALNGTSEALMSIDNLAHKCKFKQVKNAAVQALENAADALGITRDELGDRIIPDLGFNQGMKRIFDYGTRQFKVYLTPTLELEVYDENDKKLKNIPAPSKKDNPEIAKKSNDDFKQMKKQLKSIVNIQKVRLETALISDRRWKVDAWTNLFVKNPIMHGFATGLIWAAYVENKLVQTFRYMEDGTFNTQDEDEYTLPENCTIGLVHPIDLDEDSLNTWKEQLSDYEIIQPIIQLDRPVFLVNDDEKEKRILERYNGKTVSSYKLLSRMTKAGWNKGSVQDAGSFYEFYRILAIGTAVSLRFSGMYVGYDSSDEEVTIKSIFFYKPGFVQFDSGIYDKIEEENILPLGKVNNRYFSEVIALFENLFKDNEE